MFEHKPDNIYLRFENCPHFERCDDAEALDRIEAYTGTYNVYIPRPDDTPPDGWEEINERNYGPDWRNGPAKIKEMMRKSIEDHNARMEAGLQAEQRERQSRRRG